MDTARNLLCVAHYKQCILEDEGTVPYRLYTLLLCNDARWCDAYHYCIGNILHVLQSFLICGSIHHTVDTAETFLWVEAQQQPASCQVMRLLLELSGYLAIEPQISYWLQSFPPRNPQLV